MKKQDRSIEALVKRYENVPIEFNPPMDSQPIKREYDRHKDKLDELRAGMIKWIKYYVDCSEDNEIDFEDNAIILATINEYENEVAQGVYLDDNGHLLCNCYAEDNGHFTVHVERFDIEILLAILKETEDFTHQAVTI